MGDWLSMGPLFLSFPQPFRVVVNREALVGECYVGEGGFVSLTVTFRRVLRQFEVPEYKPLLSLLANIFICRGVADGHFSSSLSPGNWRRSWMLGPLALVWVGLAPPRIEAFCWLLVYDKALTADNLKRRGLTLEAISKLCALQQRKGGY